MYGIWKNDIGKRKSIWEDVMKETLNFFERMTELGYEDRIGQQEICHMILLKVLEIIKILQQKQAQVLENPSSYVYWIERNKKNYLIASCPKNINERVKKILFDDKETVKVLTSATLNTSEVTSNYYDYFMESVGLARSSDLFISEPKGYMLVFMQMKE